MTKQEFIERTRAQQKHGNGWSIALLALFFVALGGNAFLARHMDSFPPPWKIVWAVAFFAFLLSPLPLIVWISRRESQKHGLRCPSCDKALLGVGAQIAIASSHCGYCGARLFDAESTTATPAKP